MAGANGTYTMSNGSLNSTYANIGVLGTGGFTQSGGVNTIATELEIGQNSTGIGTYVISGGSLSAPRMDVGYYGNGTFTQEGTASVNISNIFYMSTKAGSTGTYNLNGGTLSVPTFSAKVAGSTSTFNVNGVTTSGTIDGAWTTLPVDNFNVAKTNNSTASFNLGSKTLQANYVQIAGGTNSTGALTVGGGTVSATSIDSGYNGNGTMTQTGGSVTLTDNLNLGLNATGNGTYNMSGGTLNITGVSAGLDVGHLGTGTFNQSGGTVTIANNLYLGLTDISNSNYNLSGTGQLNSQRLVQGNGSTGTFTQTGGAATFSSQVYMGLQPAGNAIYNLNGGTLSVASFEPNGAGTSTLNVNGGTLTGAWTTLPVDNFNVGSSGAFTLANGKTLTATSITDAGTLAVNGNVNGGSLNVSGTLKGAGTLTGVATTIASGGILNPGNSPGTITFDGGTLEWAPGGSVVFEISDAAGIAGTDWDLIRLINGATLNITATPENKFNVIFRGIDPITGLPGDPANYSPIAPYTWLFIEDRAGTGYTRGYITGFDLDSFNITYDGFTVGGAFSLELVNPMNGTQMPELPAGVALPLLALLGSAMVLFKKRIFAPAKKK